MKIKKSLVGMSVAGALIAMSGNAAASAFALIEQSSGLGNAFAGGAAGAEDATTIFFNPAGMSRLKGKQVTVAGSLIQPSAKFSDTGSQAATAQATLGGNGGDAGGLAFVPNTYMVMEVEPALRFGLGINAPFGLKTDYDPTWVGRFQAITSKIQTVNLNPSLAYQMNDSVSLGLGLNYQRISGDLSSAVNYSAAAGLALVTTPGLTPLQQAALGAVAVGSAEGVSAMSGSDSAWGYNFGALINVTPGTRIGLSYRSKIKYNLNGTVSFSNVPAALSGSPTLANGDVTLPITMPDTASISGFPSVERQVGPDGRCDLDGLGRVAATGDHPHQRGRRADHSRELEKHLACGSRGKLSLQRTMDVPPWRCIRPDAGSRCIPHCPYSRTATAHGWRLAASTKAHLRARLISPMRICS